MKRTLVTLAATAAVAASAIGFAAPAHADVSTNKTKNDAWGYCIANHIANFNDGHNGIGWLRSDQTGQAISDAASNPPPVCVASQGTFPQISNNG